MAFEPATKDAVSRLRSRLGDTEDNPFIFSPDEVAEMLQDTWRRDWLFVYYDATFDAATTATIAVATGDTVELTLSTDLDGDDPFDLTELRYDYVFELLNAINALGRGWKIGIQVAGRPELIGVPIRSTSLEVTFPSYARRLRSRSWDLADTGGSVDVYGSAKETFLPFYDMDAAELEGLGRLMTRKPKAWSDGRVRWTRDSLKERMRALRGPSALGTSRFGG